MAAWKLDNVGADVGSFAPRPVGFTTRSSLHTTEVHLTEGCSVSEQGTVHGYPA
jgi:hypothetical protein